MSGASRRNDDANPRVVVLGSGRIGAAIARDLARGGDIEVTAADADAGALRHLAEAAWERDGTSIATYSVDLADPAALAGLLRDTRLAVGAVPGPMGFGTLRRVLEAGVDMVDISFFEEDAFELDPLASGLGRTALVDCGVAPGLSNLVLGALEAELDSTDRFECLVGGLPGAPSPPWEYRAPFSPIDVIAEYTRPARLRRHGRDIILAALTEVEEVEFPGIGRLEAFNTDGLRTLLRTSRAPNLVEKTLRYPGHADRVRALRDSGFFGTEPVDLPSGVRVRPLELSAALLFRAWHGREGEDDLTAMRIVVEGRDARGAVRHTFHLLDRYDVATRTSSMARATGYTATALARLVLSGGYKETGISPPERVGASPGALDFVLRELAARGVMVKREAERLPPASRGA